MILIAKGMGLTTWTKISRNNELKAFSKFIKLHDDHLEDFAKVKMATMDDTEIVKIQASTAELLKLHQNQIAWSDSLVKEAANRAIDNWLGKEATAFLGVLKTMPQPVIDSLANSLKIKAPLAFYQAISWISKTSERG